MGSQLRRKHKISQKDGDNETQIDHSTRSENQPEKQTHGCGHFGAQENKSVTVSTVSQSIAMK